MAISEVVSADSEAAESAGTDAASRRSGVADKLLQIRRWAEDNLQLENSVIRWDALLIVAARKNASIEYAELAKAVGRSPRAVQYVLRDLQTCGLIKMERSLHDRRCVIISLTEKGERKLDELADLVDGFYGSARPATRRRART